MSKRVAREWGYEEWICNNELYCAKVLVFNKKLPTPIHRHHVKDEVIYKPPYFHDDEGGSNNVWGAVVAIGDKNGIKSVHELEGASQETKSIRIKPGQWHSIIPWNFAIYNINGVFQGYDNFIYVVQEVSTTHDDRDVEFADNDIVTNWEETKALFPNLPRTTDFSSFIQDI